MAAITRHSHTEKQKNWGVTRRLGTRLWHASILAGGYSSIHRHNHHSNFFYVLSGHLRIRIYGDDRSAVEADDRPIQIISLSPTQSCAVPPGVWHEFFATDDCELIEYYAGNNPAAADPGEDIVRKTEGGLSSKLPPQEESTR